MKDRHSEKIGSSSSASGAIVSSVWGVRIWFSAGALECLRPWVQSQALKINCKSKASYFCRDPIRLFYCLEISYQDDASSATECVTSVTSPAWISVSSLWWEDMEPILFRTARTGHHRSSQWLLLVWFLLTTITVDSAVGKLHILLPVQR